MERWVQSRRDRQAEQRRRRLYSPDAGRPGKTIQGRFQTHLRHRVLQRRGHDVSPGGGTFRTDSAATHQTSTRCSRRVNQTIRLPHCVYPRTSPRTLEEEGRGTGQPRRDCDLRGHGRAAAPILVEAVPAWPRVSIPPREVGCEGARNRITLRPYGFICSALSTYPFQDSVHQSASPSGLCFVVLHRNPPRPGRVFLHADQKSPAYFVAWRVSVLVPNAGLEMHAGDASVTLPKP